MADEDDPKTDPELELDDPEPQPEPEPDEPETEPTDEPEPIAASAEPEPEPQRPSRSQSRIQTLTHEIRDRDQRLEQLNRRLDELTQQVRQPKPQAETPEQRAQRRALMTPQDVMSEELREAREGFSQQINQMQWQNAEVADRTAFQAKCATSPLHAKYAPKVEGKLAELRTRGGNAEREVLLKFLIGEAALERYSSKEGRGERTAARERVRRATTKPSNSGSDEAATRRREESLERRLENLNI